MIKINRKEALKARAGISYFEILTLILGTIAFAYLVAMVDNEVKIVKAAETLQCCPVDKLGSACNDYPNSQCSDKCSSSCMPTSCSQLASCKLGCCYDKEEGTCSPTTAQTVCESDGGLWKDNAQCNLNSVPECKRGCCVLGSNAQFITAGRCQKLSQELGLTPDFRAGINSEPECLFLTGADDYGACVLENRGCRMITNQECRSLTGSNIIIGKLCTSPALNTTCTKTENTVCVEGKDGTYYLDSCGNQANIYDSGKYNDASYWDRIFRVEESCGASNTNGNVESRSCGNCNRFLGSRCENYVEAGTSAPDKGQNICSDLGCKQAPGNAGTKKDRKNGESWCVYDGQVGDGKDVVGSRHWKYTCTNGKVEVEGCEDLRNGICVEADADIGGGKKFAVASCRVNNWRDCLALNSDEVTREECPNTLDCFVKKINVADYFKFDVCLPEYPPGFDLISENEGKEAETICSMATQKCVVVYVKNWKGKFECKANCACEKAGFAQQMNELCTSLGDCGGKVNVEGKFDNSGYAVKKSPRLSKTEVAKYVSYAKPVAGQMADPGNITKYLEENGMIAISDGTGNPVYKPGSIKYMSTLGMGASAVGYSIAVYSGLAAGATLSNSVIGAASYGALSSGTAFSAGLAGFANVAIAVGAVLVVTMIAAKFMGINDNVAVMVAAGVGIVASLVLGGPYGIAAALLVLTIFKIMGVGKKKKVIVEFTCKPYTPPIGGNDCEKCNKDSLKPCSSYKCASLGTACQFINEGSGEELCISTRDDGIAPVISPWRALFTNFTLTESSNGFKIKGSDGKCVEQFKKINLGVLTSEPAQCRIETVSTPTFENMENSFGSSLFVYNHSIQFIVPSVDAILAEINGSIEFIAKDGNIRLYVRCQDKFGNSKPNEYLIETCTKLGPHTIPPEITMKIPADGSFLSIGTKSENATFYTDEPADCKWSQSDKNYTAMENNMTCLNSLDSQEIYGWPCFTTLTNLSKGENKYYLRCKDQPWLEGENESKRNENKASIPYTLKVTENALVIDSISPNGTSAYGSEPVEINLEVKTSGGAENGKANCEFSFTGTGYTYFINTGETTHTQPFNQMSRGNYNIRVKCTDVAGNIATGNTNVKISIDSDSPKVTRVYNSGGSLYVYTDENSECAFSNKACKFIFSNGTSMGGGFTQEHFTDWNTALPYYIKCRDLYGNEPGGNSSSTCSFKVRAYNWEE